MNQKATVTELDALHRLMEYALRDEEESGEIAKFLSAWDGYGFRECEVCVSDPKRNADMLEVFRMLARTRDYPQALGYANDLGKIRCKAAQMAAQEQTEHPGRLSGEPSPIHS